MAAYVSVQGGGRGQGRGVDEELSAQRRADLMRQRAELAREEARRLDGAAALWQGGGW